MVYPCGFVEHKFKLLQLNHFYNSVIVTTSFYGMNQKQKKSLFPKFQLIPILCFQVMHDCVYFIAPIDNYVE